MVVVTLSGKAEAGKDSAANIMKEILEKKGKKCLIIHYADYLKFICEKYFGWDGKKDLHGRALLQYVGTDLIRKKNPDFWLNVVVNLLIVVGAQYDYVFIPDARFPNEVDKMMANFDTISVYVERTDYENSLTPEQRLHASETALDGHPFDFTITSPTGLDKLAVEVKDFLKLLDYI
jgi:hypothetical protein